jgi:hypothetical protein
VTKDEVEALLAKMRAAYAAGDMETAMAWARRAAPHVHKRPAPIAVTPRQNRARLE